MPAPEDALRELAAALRAEESVISPHVREPGVSARPALGLLAAAGPRAARSPADYAIVIEAVREGYLLHYGSPRLVADADADLALLAGDYLYAIGLERLAALGDLDAVRELSDLISLAAEIHGEPERAPRVAAEAAAAWLASTIAVAAGGAESHEVAKRAMRSGDPEAAVALWAGARKRAAAAGIDDQLRATADAIDFRPDHLEP